MPETSTDPIAVGRAAAAIVGAEALLITAGAGMGVDSGLPDFRGVEGFWRAYPAYGHLGLSFAALANPRWFVEDPHLAWGFYGHRLNLYRATTPHGGFGLLRAWATLPPRGAFVFTSNVDGQFQRAGFDSQRLVERHGTIEVWQCTGGCGLGLFAAPAEPVVVDAETFRARDPLPHCPACGGLARPNVLMFDDGGWNDERTAEQEARFEDWLAPIERARARLTIVECGAGTAVPTVRRMAESLVRRRPDTTSLVRINAREADGPPGTIAIPDRAGPVLAAIAAHLAAGGAGPVG